MIIRSLVMGITLALFSGVFAPLAATQFGDYKAKGFLSDYSRLGEAGTGVAKDEPGSTPFLGEATIEMEALDSTTNEQVGAFIEERVGKKYHWTKGLKTATKDYLKAYSTWAYTRQAMDHWAQMVRERLDAHNATSPVTK